MRHFCHLDLCSFTDQNGSLFVIDEEDIMSKLKKNKETSLGGPSSVMTHHGPVAGMSRRELLSMSATGALTYGLLPSLTSMLFTNTGFAQELACAVAEANTNTLPYLVLDCAGGMNIAGGNILMGYTRGGDQLDYSRPGGVFDKTDYLKLGISAAGHPSLASNVNSDYGLKFHSLSGVLRGLESILGLPANKQLKAKIDGCIFALRTADDTGNNPQNTAYLAHRAGSHGSLVGLIGTQNSISGGNSASPSFSIDLTLKPSVVRNDAEAKQLLSVGNLSSTRYLNHDNDQGKLQERMRFVLGEIKKMSSARLKDFSTLNASAQVQKIIGCSQSQAAELLTKYSSSVLSIVGDDAIQSSFGTTDQETAVASKLILDRLAGVATVVVGGCDYHDGTNTTGDAKDFSIGVKMAKAILAASKKGRSLMIHWITDGAVTSSQTGTLDVNGRPIWVSDQGPYGSSVLLAYKHTHDP